MENATDALLMAFAILIFIIALSVSLTTLAQAKSTADIVLFSSDRTITRTLLGVQYDDEIAKDGGRVVGVDTVIATIARTSKEMFAVKIVDNDTYFFEYDKQDKNEFENEIKRFIKEHIGKEYKETYVEVPVSGIIYEGEDGTILEQDSIKKIYITYEKIS